MNYELYMAEAIAEARRGAEEGETPVGAVAVLDDAMIARDHDRIGLQRDPTAHAVLLTVQAAARQGGGAPGRARCGPRRRHDRPRPRSDRAPARPARACRPAPRAGGRSQDRAEAARREDYLYPSRAVRDVHRRPRRG